MNKDGVKIAGRGGRALKWALVKLTSNAGFKPTKEFLSKTLSMCHLYPFLARNIPNNDGDVIKYVEKTHLV